MNYVSERARLDLWGDNIERAWRRLSLGFGILIGALALIGIGAATGIVALRWLGVVACLVSAGVNFTAGRLAREPKR